MKHNFNISFEVTESELSQSEFVDYLIDAFQIGIQQIASKDYKKFFWNLPSKYNKNTDKENRE